MVGFYSEHNLQKEKEEQRHMLSVAIKEKYDAIIERYTTPELITEEHFKLAIDEVRKDVEKRKQEGGGNFRVKYNIDSKSEKILLTLISNAEHSVFKKVKDSLANDESNVVIKALINEELESHSSNKPLDLYATNGAGKATGVIMR